MIIYDDYFTNEKTYVAEDKMKSIPEQIADYFYYNYSTKPTNPNWESDLFCYKDIVFSIKGSPCFWIRMSFVPGGSILVKIKTKI